MVSFVQVLYTTMEMFLITRSNVLLACCHCNLFREALLFSNVVKFPMCKELDLRNCVLNFAKLSIGFLLRSRRVFCGSEGGVFYIETLWICVMKLGSDLSLN
jgi:hypothetical protein